MGSGVTAIGSNAFGMCSRLGSIFYKGTPSERAKIYIGAGNYTLDGATTYYFSERAPSEAQWAESPDWWHYDGATGEVVLWAKQSGNETAAL